MGKAVIITFTVPGQPVAKGRPKVASRGKFSHLYTPEKTVNYEGLVAICGKQAMCGLIPLGGPVSVSMDVQLIIPASWSLKKKRSALDGVVAATKKPDLDNIIKSIFDGMNGVVLMDDVQVVEISARKRYSNTPGVEVTVSELNFQSA